MRERLDPADEKWDERVMMGGGLPGVGFLNPFVGSRGS